MNSSNKMFQNSCNYIAKTRAPSNNKSNSQNKNVCMCSDKQAKCLNLNQNMLCGTKERCTQIFTFLKACSHSFKKHVIILKIQSPVKILAQTWYVLMRWNEPLHLQSKVLSLTFQVWFSTFQMIGVDKTYAVQQTFKQ